MQTAFLPSASRVFNGLAAFQLSSALRAAIELDFFTSIAEGHNTTQKLADHCKVHPRGARILADYLVINKFLIKNGDFYSLSAESAAYLDRRASSYEGDPVRFVQSRHIRAHFDELTERVRHGGVLETAESVLSPDHEVWVDFARYMAGHIGRSSNLLAQHVLSKIVPPVNRPMKILDIAAGHGLFGIAFAVENPQAHIIAQDWPAILPVAVENATKSGVADRYTTLPGSAFDVDFGTDYDIILIPNFLHHFDAGINTALLKKVARSLKSGGIAITVEYAPNDDRLTPTSHAAFALYLLATTPGGDAYTINELKVMYDAAGYQQITSLELGPGGQRVIVGTISR